MKNKYEIQYHVNKDGSAEFLCELLDCFEQPCYFQYKKLFDRNPWIFFCGNLNMAFSIEDKISFGVTLCKERKKYYDIQTISINGEHYKKITDILNAYGEIIIITAFNYISDYVWYEEEGKNEIHTQHCTYLIGENESDYYIVDNPYVFCNAEKLKWKTNNSIFSIPKVHFAEAFEKCCIIKTIKFENVPHTEEEELAYFKAVCKEICEDYEGKFDAENNLTGRRALLFLKKELEKENENTVKDFFIFHIMVSRRVIFKRCLTIFNTYMYSNSKIHSLLNFSIESWKAIKELAIEHHYHNKNVCKLAAEKVEKLIEIENALINEVAGIRWKDNE